MSYSSPHGVAAIIKGTAQAATKATAVVPFYHDPAPACTRISKIATQQRHPATGIPDAFRVSTSD